MKKLLTTIAIIGSLTAFGQTAEDSYNSGSKKLSAKEYAGAIKDFDKAIKTNPNLKEAYFNRGYAKSNLKDYKGAIADYTKVVELDPAFKGIYFNRALTKIYMDDYVGALNDLNEEIKLNPNDGASYCTRGQVKMQKGDMSDGCEDLNKAKELGDKRAPKFIEEHCGKTQNTPSTKKSNETLMIDWPDAEGWRVANQQDNAEQNMIELLRNKETFDNWTEIGTMQVFKGIGASKKIPITKDMDGMYEQAKKNCSPSAKLTMIDKDETAKYPWIIFKIECSSSKGTESQVYYIIQGTDELFINFRAVKQKKVPADLQDKWVKFFKTAKIVTQ